MARRRPPGTDVSAACGVPTRAPYDGFCASNFFFPSGVNAGSDVALKPYLLPSQTPERSCASNGWLSGTSGGAPRPSTLPLPPPRPPRPRPWPPAARPSPCCAATQRGISNDIDSRASTTRVRIVPPDLQRDALLPAGAGTATASRRLAGRDRSVATSTAGIHDELALVVLDGPDAAVKAANPRRAERHLDDRPRLERLDRTSFRPTSAQQECGIGHELRDPVLRLALFIRA